LLTGHSSHNKNTASGVTTVAVVAVSVPGVIRGVAVFVVASLGTIIVLPILPVLLLE
jgi:hypothetical protein